MQTLIDQLKYHTYTLEEVCDELRYELTPQLQEYVMEFIEPCEQCGLWCPLDELHDGVCDYCWDSYGTQDYDSEVF